MPQTGQAAAPAPMGGTQHRAEQAEGQQVRDPQGWGQQGGSSGRRTRAVSFEAVSAPQERAGAGRLRTGGRGPIPAGNHGTFTERRGPALTAPGLREVPAEPPPRRREGPRSCPTTLYTRSHHLTRHPVQPAHPQCNGLAKSRPPMPPNEPWCPRSPGLSMGHSRTRASSNVLCSRQQTLDKADGVHREPPDEPRKLAPGWAWPRLGALVSARGGAVPSAARAFPNSLKKGR